MEAEYVSAVTGMQERLILPARVAGDWLRDAATSSLDRLNGRKG